MHQQRRFEQQIYLNYAVIAEDVVSDRALKAVVLNWFHFILILANLMKNTIQV